MWWFAAPIVIGIGKVIYDAVTDDSSSSSSTSSSTSSNYEQQKKKQQAAAEAEAKQRAKDQQKQRLIRQLSDHSTKGLGVIRDEYLSTNTQFFINNMTKLKKMTNLRVHDVESALESLRVVADSKVVFKKEYDSANFDQQSLNEIQEMCEIECEITHRLIN